MVVVSPVTIGNASWCTEAAQCMCLRVLYEPKKAQTSLFQPCSKIWHESPGYLPLFFYHSDFIKTMRRKASRYKYGSQNFTCAVLHSPAALETLKPRFEQQRRGAICPRSIVINQ